MESLELPFIISFSQFYDQWCVLLLHENFYNFYSSMLVSKDVYI